MFSRPGKLCNLALACSRLVACVAEVVANSSHTPTLPGLPYLIPAAGSPRLPSQHQELRLWVICGRQRAACLQRCATRTSGCCAQQHSQLDQRARRHGQCCVQHLKDRLQAGAAIQRSRSCGQGGQVGLGGSTQLARVLGGPAGLQYLEIAGLHLQGSARESWERSLNSAFKQQGSHNKQVGKISWAEWPHLPAPHQHPQTNCPAVASCPGPQVRQRSPRSPA